MTNAEARFNKSLRPRKPEGSLGRTAQDVHLDSHTAPELCRNVTCPFLRIGNVNVCDSVAGCVFFFLFFFGGGVIVVVVCLLFFFFFAVVAERWCYPQELLRRQ